MTSKLSRDRLQEIAEDGLLKHGESKALARMALAAMDSEPVALQPELAKVIYHFRDWNEGFPVERFKADYVISWMLANYPPAPPAPRSYRSLNGTSSGRPRAPSTIPSGTRR